MRLMEQEVNVASVPDEAIVVRRVRQRRILTFLTVFGPGLMVTDADNDAGAVSAYTAIRASRWTCIVENTASITSSQTCELAFQKGPIGKYRSRNGR